MKHQHMNAGRASDVAVKRLAGNSAVGAGLGVDPILPGVPLAGARIHHRPPQRRDHGDQQHGCVAEGHLWAVVDVTQGVKGARSVMMMIRVALEMKEQPVGQTLRRVPRVPGGGALIDPAPLWADRASTQRVVLDVVDGLQQDDGDDGLHDKEDDTDDAGDAGDDGDGGRHQQRMAKTSIPQAQRRQPQPTSPLAFQVPGRDGAADDGAGQEGIDALAEARGRGIVGGGHAFVMAMHVLDTKVRVQGEGHQRFCGAPLGSRGPVHELMGHVDAGAADESARRREEHKANDVDGVDGDVGEAVYCHREPRHMQGDPRPQPDVEAQISGPAGIKRHADGSTLSTQHEIQDRHQTKDERREGEALPASRVDGDGDAAQRNQEREDERKRREGCADSGANASAIDGA